MSNKIKTRNMRDFREVEEEYLRKHPKEIETYLDVQLEEYAKDGNTGALMSSLRVIGRVVGVSKLATESGMTRKGLQKALSEDGNPKFSNICAIMHAMGYRLAPVRLEEK